MTIQEEPCTVKDVLETLIEILVDSRTEPNLGTNLNTFDSVDKSRLTTLLAEIQQLEG
jgi:hypothetical protein